MKEDNRMENNLQPQNLAICSTPAANNLPAQATPPATRAQSNQPTPEVGNSIPAYEQICMFNDKLSQTHNAARAQTTDEKKLRKVKELSVFTYAKQLTKYVFQCTKNAPKTYRWSVIAKMQTISLNLIENLYKANAQIDATRLTILIEADTQLKLLAFTAEIAKDMTVISAHQFKTLSKHLLNCKKTLWGWIKCKK